ncbi:MAG: hypothetical protein JWP75_3993, partial [Frondihabitans sp.]|nr:hypothetical protein [Frondihabitans sp.]
IDEEDQEQQESGNDEDEGCPAGRETDPAPTLGASARGGGLEGGHESFSFPNGCR